MIKLVCHLVLFLVLSGCVKQAKDLSFKLNTNSQSQIVKDVTKYNSLVTAVAISLKQKKIISGSFDNTAKVTNWGDKSEFVIQHSGSVTAIAFKVITGSYDNTAKVTDLFLKTELIIQHKSAVSSVAFSPNGSKVITGSYDKTAQVTTLKDLSQITISHKDWINVVEFSPDGTKVLTASEDNTAKVTTLIDQSELVIQHNGWVRSARFSADGKKVVTGSYDGLVKFTDLTNNRFKDFFQKAAVNAISIMTRDIAVIGLSNGEIKIIDGYNSKEVFAQGVNQYLSSLVLTFDGNFIVTGLSTGEVKLYVNIWCFKLFVAFVMIVTTIPFASLFP